MNAVYSYNRIDNRDINLTPRLDTKALAMVCAGQPLSAPAVDRSDVFYPQPSFQANAYLTQMVMQQLQIQYLEMMLLQQLMAGQCQQLPQYPMYPMVPQPMMMPQAPWMDGGMDYFDSCNFQDPFSSQFAEPNLPADPWQPPAPILQVGAKKQIASSQGNPRLSNLDIPQTAHIRQIGSVQAGAVQIAKVKDADANIHQVANNPSTLQRAEVENGTAIIRQENGSQLQAFVQGGGAAHIEQQAAGKFNNLQASFGKGGGTCNQVGNSDKINNFFISGKDSDASIRVNQTGGSADDFFGIRGGNGNDSFNINTGAGNDQVKLTLSAGQDSYNIIGDGQTEVKISPKGQDFKVVDDRGRVLHEGSGSVIRVKAGTKVSVFDGREYQTL